METFLPAKPSNFKKKLRTLCAVFTFTVSSVCAQVVVAQENPDSSQGGKIHSLFSSGDTLKAQRKSALETGKRNKRSIRQRSVQVDMGRLKSKYILLNLFDDTEFIAERTHFKKGPEGEYTWSGKLKGPIHGVAHITVFGDGVAGSITTENGLLFEVNSNPDGQIVIEEVNSEMLPPHAEPLVPDEETSFEKDSLNNVVPAPLGDSGVTIDLMVVYTPASRVRYGESGIQSRIINAVDAMNVANADSLVDARYRLVYMGEINFVETGDMEVALNKITNTTDGEMDNVHGLRDQYGADIVSLIVEDNNYCGIAWVMSPSLLINNRMASRAFNVTYSGCLTSFTLAHEIGHNEGCSHDRANGGGGSYEYSFGHRDTTEGFRTIMSYPCSGGGCPRIPQFSNPSVNYNGAPTGVDHNADPANSADNARTKNNNETIIANWRQAVETTVPQSPDNLNVVAFSESRIDITWVDNADNEEGFFLERSPNGTDPWTEIATLTSNATGYSDNGLTASTTYFYRVRAYNGVGNSVYSNIDSTATLSAGNVTPNAAFTFSTSGLTGTFRDTSTDSDGTLVRWFWDFGDGATSTTQNPSHTYSSSGVYTVRLIVTDNDGASGDSSRSITIIDNSNRVPNAAFTFSTSGLTVNFRDTSTDSDGTITSRMWNFGDGATSTSKNPSHTYSSSDVYTARLTVTDNDGASDTSSQSVTVTAPNKSPTSRFSFRTSGLSVNFTDASTDSDGTIASRLWNFGDGNVSTLTNPNHTYTSGGAYTVRLTVTDNNGASRTSSKRVIVLHPKRTRGILYIFCYLYGCNSNDRVPDAKPVTQVTPSVKNAPVSSSPKSTDDRKSAEPVITSRKAPSVKGNVSRSRNTNFVAAPRPLAAPSNLTVSVQDDGESNTKTATFRWTDNSNNELEFVIERCEQTGTNKTCKFVEWVKVLANTTILKDVPVSAPYKYRIKARNRTEDSAYSKEVKI